MDIATFVDKLATFAPTLNELKPRGFTIELANRYAKMYHGERRPSSLTSAARSVEPNDVLELQNWDLHNIEIGMVCFPDPPMNGMGHHCIGCVESDPMVVLSESTEIAVLEFGTKGHLLWPVAKDLSSMFDALIIAARFISNRSVGKFAYDDFATAKKIATECGAAAGGDKYREFYSMLLGAEE